MKAKINYTQRQYNWFNDADEGVTAHSTVVDIGDDGCDGKALGDMILGLFQGGAKVHSVELVPQYLNQVPPSALNQQA